MRSHNRLRPRPLPRSLRPLHLPHHRRHSGGRASTAHGASSERQTSPTLRCWWWWWWCLLCWLAVLRGPSSFTEAATQGHARGTALDRPVFPLEALHDFSVRPQHTIISDHRNKATDNNNRQQSLIHVLLVFWSPCIIWRRKERIMDWTTTSSVVPTIVATTLVLTVVFVVLWGMDWQQTTPPHSRRSSPQQTTATKRRNESVYVLKTVRLQPTIPLVAPLPTGNAIRLRRLNPGAVDDIRLSVWVYDRKGRAVTGGTSELFAWRINAEPLTVRFHGGDGAVGRLVVNLLGMLRDTDLEISILSADGTGLSARGSNPTDDDPVVARHHSTGNTVAIRNDLRGARGLAPQGTLGCRPTIVGAARGRRR